MDKLNTVCPDDFVCKMKDRWKQTLTLSTNSELENCWRNLADCFNAQILNRGNPWTSFAMPTGTGKTEGLVVYCSMLIEANSSHPDSRSKALIVCRTIAQCDDLAKKITGLAGSGSAVAKHSQNPIDPLEVAQFDVVIITHEAYRLALKSLKSGEHSQWTEVVQSHADLVVVDEALEGLVEFFSITSADLHNLLSCIPQTLKRNFIPVVELLQQLISTIQKWEVTDATNSSFLWHGKHDCPLPDVAPEMFAEFNTAVANGGLEASPMLQAAGSKHCDIIAFAQPILTSVEHISSSWALFAKQGGRVGLHNAALIIPPDLKGPVVLDATAKLAPLSLINGSEMALRGSPRGVRKYNQVTLHVARGKKTGKSALIKDTEKKLQMLYSHLTKNLPNASALICLPQKFEAKARDLQPMEMNGQLAHWGAIDGKNTWHYRDTIVIATLPYRKRLDHLLMYLAVHGPKDASWLSQPNWGGYQSIIREMEIRQVAASVLQAINRIRCRRPINQRGECLPCDVFVVLPKDSRGDDMLSFIEEEMPGVEVKDWPFTFDTPRSRGGHSGSTLDVFADALENIGVGETTTRDLCQQLGFTRGALKELHRCLKDTSHWIHTALEDAGVSVHHNGRGGRASAYTLVKT